jgi:hypothetical protein
MGYSTDFYGSLDFTQPLTPDQKLKLKEFLGEDIRDHEDWTKGTEFEDKWLTNIDLRLTEDMKGLEWDESEKTYDLVEKVNLILFHMRKLWSDFGLKGRMDARGESSDDTWVLAIDDSGKAICIDAPVLAVDTKITCPHCQTDFKLEEGMDD